MDKKHKELKADSKSLTPAVQIGKAGVNESIITEVKRQLQQKKMIKVKLLRSAIEDKDKKKIAKDLAKKTNSEIIDLIGFTITHRKL